MANAVDAGCSNTARRNVDDTFKSDIIQRVHQQSEISEHIFYFHTFIEAKPTINAVRNTTVLQSHFKRARHIGRAIEYSNVPVIRLTVGIFILIGNIVYAFCHPSGFIFAFRLAIRDDVFSIKTVRIKVFSNPLLVISDELVSGCKDLFCGTIVLIENDSLGTGIGFVEIQDKRLIRTPPSVNSLIGIAHDINAGIGFCKKTHQAKLNIVRILKLIDQNMVKAACPFRSDIRSIFKNSNGVKQKVIKIESITSGFRLLVHQIKFNKLLFVFKAFFRNIDVFRVNPACFLRIHITRGLFREGVLLFVSEF